MADEQKIDDGEAAFPHPDLADRSAAPGLTLRQYAAIKLRVPDSGLPWLDAMIQKSRRDAFAGASVVAATDALMNPLDADGNLDRSAATDHPEDIAEAARMIADALLAAREEGGGA